jgi:eukaryotic-like serine/threonine-protein kinase
MPFARRGTHGHFTDEPMIERPPAQLTAMLERLGLATAAEVAGMGRRVKRLAHDLPRFESVWVDALSQARILTPFQAAEINAGRGQRLRLGPYVLRDRLPHPHYVACYRARNVDSRESVLLAVVENAGPRAEEIRCQLESLASVGWPPAVARAADSSPPAPHPSPLALITHAGGESERVFAAAPWVEGQTAAQWMVHHGRFPPEVVLEIARAMLASLIEFDRAGVCHGDVSTSSLILTDSGGVVLVLPGLRGILRPEEGYTHTDLLPEGYDSLAPERISAGTPPNAASDIYACGCVWWHLLCGRPPLLGGSGLAKLRAAQAAEICDVRQYAPAVSAPLATALSACLERDPSRRPESIARLAAMLGPPTRRGKEVLADCLARAGRPTVPWTTTVRSIRTSNRTPLWIAGATCCLAVVLAILWPWWHGRSTSGIERPDTAVAVKDTHRPPGPRSRGVRESLTAVSKTGRENVGIQTPVDSGVVQAAYQQAETRPPDLVLAADRPLAATSLDLRAGQRVRGASGRRVAILVPRAGLLVDKENVRFENIDFVWRHLPAANDAQTSEPGAVQLLASRAEFCGCSFQCEAGQPGPVSAIRWLYPARANQSDTSLPSGRLRLADCLLYRVGIGVDCRRVGAVAIELKNLLHLDAGPLVRLDHCPGADEPVSIGLGQVTLRAGGPLLECLLPRIEQQPGEITVLATACAFVPEAGVPLVRLTGAELPQQLLANVRWSGQGSLVTPQTAMIARYGPNGQEQSVDESAISIAGLVRSEVGFAGAASGDPAASRLIRWQAPLQSADPPGIDPAPLPTLLAP